VLHIYAICHLWMACFPRRVERGGACTLLLLVVVKVTAAQTSEREEYLHPIQIHHVAQEDIPN